MPVEPGDIQIDADGHLWRRPSGNVRNLTPDRERYNFVPRTDKYGRTMLLKDDGFRIWTIWTSDNPVNDPVGQREWEILWEYKHVDAPGVRVAVALIMGYDSEE